MTTSSPRSGEPSTDPDSWTIDPAHSVAEFTGRRLRRAGAHYHVSTVRGRFRALAGTIHLDEATPAPPALTLTLDAAGLDPQMLADGFFTPERFPTMTFRSARVERVDATRARVFGALTVRDRTREATLDLVYEGQRTDADGRRRAAFTAETALDREGLGLDWNSVSEAGGYSIGGRLSLRIAAFTDGVSRGGAPVDAAPPAVENLAAG